MSSPANWSDYVLAEFIEYSVNNIRSYLDEVETSLRNPIACLGAGLKAPSDSKQREVNKFCEDLGRYKCKVVLLARTLERLSPGHRTPFNVELVKHLDAATLALEKAIAKLRPSTLATSKKEVRVFFVSIAEEVRTAFAGLESAHHVAQKRKEELNDLERKTPKDASKAMLWRLRLCGAFFSVLFALLLGYGLNLLFAEKPQPLNAYFVITLSVAVAVVGIALNAPIEFRRTPLAK